MIRILFTNHIKKLTGCRFYPHGTRGKSSPSFLFNKGLKDKTNKIPSASNIF
jgi:hypothetical protein